METDPLIGTILQERYRVIEKIADGAMGSVYRGEQIQLGRQVAIKFLLPAVAQQPTLLQRFTIEAKAMSRLTHPNCVSVIDFGVDRMPFLVMDFIAGETLRSVVQRGRMQPKRALAITGQILSGLAHAHAQGIVHRDIKPENVLLTNMPGFDEHVRLLDFGLAKILDSDSGLTVGVALGTPYYMAPEQIGEGVIDPRTDLYATAVLLFEMLTGTKPFGAADIGEVLLSHLESPVPLLRTVAPQAGFSHALEQALQKAMAKKPADRYPDAKTMADALAATPEAAPGTPPPRHIKTAPFGIDVPPAAERLSVAPTKPALVIPNEPPAQEPTAQETTLPKTADPHERTQAQSKPWHRLITAMAGLDVRKRRFYTVGAVLLLAVSMFTWLLAQPSDNDKGTPAPIQTKQTPPTQERPPAPKSTPPVQQSAPPTPTPPSAEKMPPDRPRVRARARPRTRPQARPQPQTQPNPRAITGGRWHTQPPPR